MELEQIFTDALLFKTLQVATNKASQLRLLVSDILDQIKFTPLIILQ